MYKIGTKLVQNEGQNAQKHDAQLLIHTETSCCRVSVFSRMQITKYTKTMDMLTGGIFILCQIDEGNFSQI